MKIPFFVHLIIVFYHLLADLHLDRKVTGCGSLDVIAMLVDLGLLFGVVYIQDIDKCHDANDC